jgi:hypothetical protein
MQSNNPKLFRLAAGILRDASADGPKTLAFTLIAPAILRAMQFVPKGEKPSVERLQAVLLDAAQALEKIASAT